MPCNWASFFCLCQPPPPPPPPMARQTEGRPENVRAIVTHFIFSSGLLSIYFPRLGRGRKKILIRKRRGEKTKADYYFRPSLHPIPTRPLVHSRPFQRETNEKSKEGREIKGRKISELPSNNAHKSRLQRKKKRREGGGGREREGPLVAKKCPRHNSNLKKRRNKNPTISSPLSLFQETRGETRDFNLKPSEEQLTRDTKKRRNTKRRRRKNINMSAFPFVNETKLSPPLLEIGDDDGGGGGGGGGAGDLLLGGADASSEVSNLKLHYSRPATIFAAVCAIIFTVVGIAGEKRRGTEHKRIIF